MGCRESQRLRLSLKPPVDNRWENVANDILILMKHLTIAVVIGVLTIGISVFVLSERDENYEGDAKEDGVIEINERYIANNYDFVPRNFECDTHQSITDDEVMHGCILNVDITNTTDFGQVLNLDGDVAVSESGEEFVSTDEDSRRFITENALAQEIEIGETVNGGIFFPVPENTIIDRVEVFETANSDPIVITFR